jgi:hypothetical protein
VKKAPSLKRHIKKNAFIFTKTRKTRKKGSLLEKIQGQTFFKNYLGRHNVTLAHLHEKKREKH